MTWDAKQLRKILTDKNISIDASTVISAITNNSFEEADIEDTFFRVKLENVSVDELLDLNNIEDYLSMVAPLPFQNHFIFKDKIYQELQKEGVSIDEYNIYVNTNQLYKSYKTILYDRSGHKVDEILDIETYKIYYNEAVIAFGWYGLRNHLNKGIPSANKARCLRLRKENIQIGSENAVERFLTEPAKNKNFIGEIYALSSDLLPNARRDYFVDNNVCQHFEKAIKEKLSELMQLTYFTSEITKKVVQITKHKDKILEYKDKTHNTGFSDKEEKQKLEEEIRELEKGAEKANEELSKIRDKAKENKSLLKIFNNIKGENSEQLYVEDSTKNQRIKFRTDKFSKYSKSERKLIGRIFVIIDKHLPPDKAKFLKLKIEEEIK